jgi:transposase
VEFSVIPQLNFDEGRQPRIILDNASIHRSQELKDLCRRHGVELSYLPPYSPDMNPIEKTFSMLKSWIKRNYMLVQEFANFGAFMLYALQQLRINEVALAFIQEGGYIQ